MARTVASQASYRANIPVYMQLRDCWRKDPVLYVRQRFGIEPTPQQVQILQAIVPSGAKVSVRSGHGIGKSSSAAWIIFWHLYTRRRGVHHFFSLHPSRDACIRLFEMLAL